MFGSEAGLCHGWFAMVLALLLLGGCQTKSDGIQFSDGKVEPESTRAGTLFSLQLAWFEQDKLSVDWAFETEWQGRIRSTDSDDMQCSGSFRLREEPSRKHPIGDWSLNCGANHQATGIMTLFTAGTGGIDRISARGFDADRNSVTMGIMP